MAYEVPLPITTLADLQELLQGLPVQGFSISPPLRLADHFLMGICHGSPEAPTCTCLDFPLTDLLAVVAVLFANPEHRVGVHSLKEMRVWFKGYGFDLPREMFLDVSLAAYVQSPPERDRGEDWRKFRLRRLVRDYLGETYPFGFTLAETHGYPHAFYEQLRQDAKYIHRLGPVLIEGIFRDQTNTLYLPYWGLELELTRVLADMEYRGVDLHTAKIARTHRRVQMACLLLCEDLTNLNSGYLDPRSAQAIRGFLHRITGQIYPAASINDDLLKLVGRQYPPVFRLRVWRRLFWALRSFFEKVQGKTRCYPRWWLTRTSVGRINCTDPALQNLPKPFRKYLSPGQGNVFLKADFSAFQLRLLAHLSQDPALLDTFRHGRNPHDETRDRLRARGIPVTRSQAKQINFLISYGGTAWSLKDYLGMGFGGLKTAQLMMKELREIYPQLFAYLDGVMEGIAASSPTERHVRSLQGRRRGFVHPGKLTAREKRQAANAVVQMLEADVFKKAILDLDEAIRSAGLPVRMVLLLHDGIWFSCAQDLHERAKVLIKQVMENSVSLSVPLVVTFD